MLAKLMETQIWHLPVSSDAPCGKSTEKVQWSLPAFLSGRKLSPSSHFDSRCFSSSLYATGTFQGATQCWNSKGVSLSESMCGFFKGNCWRLQKFLPPNQSPAFFATRRYRELSFWHWNPELGSLGCGQVSLFLRYPS